MGVIYQRFRNMGIPYPCFQYVGNILMILPIFKQQGHFMPMFNIC